MGQKNIVPILLSLLAAAGCRSTVAPPEPDRLVLFAVADLLGRFEGVPKRGCCVLPSPQVLDVKSPASWGGTPLLEDPADALLDHLRSRLAAAPGGPEDCRLGMRDGATLEARGSGPALAVVEGALAELR